MSSGISLSSSIRSSLLSLQDTAGLQSVTQNHLSTGKKVASALDNPTNFFTAASLNDRSSALTGLLDGISNGVQTIQAASKGLDSITKLVQSLQSTITQAQNDAATNRPAKTSTALATAAEGVATGKGLKDVALGKAIIDNNGVTADAATSSYAGNLAGAGAAVAIEIKAGNNTYNVDLAATATVQDAVNAINSSGIATASVDDLGKLTVRGTGSDTLKVGIGAGADATAALANAKLGGLNDEFGLAATDYTTGVTASGNSTVRSNLVQQFNSLTKQLDELARDSGFNGKNLLNGDTLSLIFNEKTGTAQSKLDVQGTTLSATSLGIGTAVSGTATAGQFNIQNDADLGTAKDVLTNALGSLRSLASTFGSSLSTVQTRQDFTKQLSNVLTTGADNLTNADLNVEAANYTALQTRQSIAQQTLGLANQANQGVLSLLR